MFNLIKKDLKLRPMESWEVMDENDVEDWELSSYRRSAVSDLLDEFRDTYNVCAVIKFKDHSPVVLSKMNYSLGRCSCCSDSDPFNNEVISVDIYEYPL